MFQPRIGERVLVRPANPAEKVPRGANLSEFLSNDWQECVWDFFHDARLHDGSLVVKALPEPMKAKEEAPLPSETPPVLPIPPKKSSRNLISE